MPFRLTSPIIKDFILKATDEANGNDGEATKIIIKQASQMDNERRSMILANNTRIMDDDPTKIKVKSEWSFEELKRMEVRLTLVGCNIEDVDGKPLFKFKSDNSVPALDMSDREFEKAWGKLPAVVANEIYSHVLEVNLDWANPFSG